MLLFCVYPLTNKVVLVYNKNVGNDNNHYGYNIMKAVLLGMMLVLGTLQYKLWIASDGVRGVRALQSQIAGQQKNNELLAEDNAVLLQHIGALKTGGTAVEARARDELGMVKNGESFYQTVG